MYLPNRFFDYILPPMIVGLVVALEKFINSLHASENRAFVRRISLYILVFVGYWILYTGAMYIESLEPYPSDLLKNSISWIYNNTEYNDVLLGSVDRGGVLVPVIYNRTSVLDDLWLSSASLPERMDAVKKFYSFDCREMCRIYREWNISAAVVTYPDALDRSTDLYTLNTTLHACTDIAFYDENTSFVMILRPKQPLEKRNHLKITQEFIKNVSLFMSAISEIISENPIASNKTEIKLKIKHADDIAGHISFNGKFLYATSSNCSEIAPELIWNTTMHSDRLRYYLILYRKRWGIRELLEMNTTYHKLNHTLYRLKEVIRDDKYSSLNINTLQREKVSN